MKVNRAHNALFNSLNQAMQEPGFNSHYLADMKLWVTHSQFIVEHINAMTTLAREHTMLTPDWRSAICSRVRLPCSGVSSVWSMTRRVNRGFEHSGSAGNAHPWANEHHGQHLQRILGHLNTMHTISSVAWRQRPHHGIWLTRRLKRTEY